MSPREGVGEKSSAWATGTGAKLPASVGGFGISFFGELMALDGLATLAKVAGGAACEDYAEQLAWQVRAQPC